MPSRMPMAGSPACRNVQTNTGLRGRSALVGPYAGSDANGGRLSLEADPDGSPGVHHQRGLCQLRHLRRQVPARGDRRGAPAVPHPPARVQRLRLLRWLLSCARHRAPGIARRVLLPPIRTARTAQVGATLRRAVGAPPPAGSRITYGALRPDHALGAAWRDLCPAPRVPLLRLESMARLVARVAMAVHDCLLRAVGRTVRPTG